LAQRMEKVHGADHYKLVDMQAGRWEPKLISRYVFAC
jgi:hypothetical protein